TRPHLRRRRRHRPQGVGLPRRPLQPGRGRSRAHRADGRAHAVRPQAAVTTTTTARVARAAALVAALGMASRLLGLVREQVIAIVYGTTGAADAYVSSLYVVNTLAAILLYVAVTLVIPVFQQERERAGTRRAVALLSALSLWLGAILVVLSAIVAIWPHAIAVLFALSGSRAATAEQLLRIMAPSILLQGLSAILTALLQVYGRFG